MFMNSGKLLRQKRIEKGLAGSLVSGRSGVSRTKLSDIECGYVLPSEDEVSRINAAIEFLADTRKLMEHAAVEAGWPGAI
jgi:transcriptional regulator with XRE-family HTH domain